jgi:hypothetical protein
MGYLDPNLFGIISQIGFMLLFGIATAVLFVPRTIGGVIKRAYQRFFPKVSASSKPHD